MTEVGGLSPSNGMTCVVVVDSRDAGRGPLSALLQGVMRAGSQPRLARDMESTLETFSRIAPAAAFIHLGVDPRPCSGGGGLQIATELRRRAPELPIILYTGNPNPPHDARGAALSRSVVLARDTQLLESLDPLVVGAARLAPARARLRARLLDVRRQTPAAVFSAPFQIRELLGQVEAALIVAGLQSRSCGHRAAAALGLAPRTLERRITELDIRVPMSVVPKPGSVRPALAHIASETASPCVVEVCDRAGADLLHLPPGHLSPRDLAEPSVACAIVCVDDVGGVVDAWKLAQMSDFVPWIARGTAAAQVAVLAEELGLEAPQFGDDVPIEVVSLLLDAGVATSRVRELVGVTSPIEERGTAMLLDLLDLLDRLRDHLVFAAYGAAGTEVGGAKLVGLEERTFAYWLKRARKRRNSRAPWTATSRRQVLQ